MRKIRHYTLVELLVVVAIAALILGIATPAFTTLIKGNAMTATTRELSAKIKAARSYAITNNCHVALLFPTGDDFNSAGMTNTNLYFRSYRPCVVLKDDSGNWIFDTWIDGENWKTMEQGIIINQNNEDFCVATASSIPYTVKEIPVGDLIKPANPTNDKIASMKRAVIFKPNGQLALNTDQVFVLRLTEGVATGKNSITITKQTSPSKTVYKEFKIHPLSCRIEFADIEAGI